MRRKVKYGHTSCDVCGYPVSKNALGRRSHRCKCHCGFLAEEWLGTKPVCKGHYFATIAAGIDREVNKKETK